MSNITIVPARKEDFSAIWPIFHRILQGGDTYVYAADTDREFAENYWMNSDVGAYAAYYDGQLAGSYVIRSNRPGYGSHVSNASFIVSPDFHGKGVGRRMGEHCLLEAKKKGFQAMQFNFVVSTNHVAVKLWQSLGFAIIGTIPKGFNHRTLGLVDAYIMHRFL